MIPILQPVFQGEWVALGEALDCPQQLPAGALAVADLVDDAARLHDCLRCHAHHLGVQGDDLRAAASAWSRAYLWTLLPPVVAAASVLHHGLPVRAAQLAVSLRADGSPARFHLPDGGVPMPDHDTAARFEGLLWHHLDPLFAAVGRVARLPVRILWGNTARLLEELLDHALALTGQAAQVEADRDALLHRPAWPDGRANALHVPALRSRLQLQQGSATAPASVAAPAAPVRLYRQCCLQYLLPGQSHCGACPLAPVWQRPVRG